MLTSLEFGADVADWIREERVPPADLVTDAMGQVHLVKLPRGPYRWRVQITGSEPVEGTLEVMPAQSTTVQLLLP